MRLRLCTHSIRLILLSHFLSFKICDKPFSDYDVQLVQLVKEVTLSAFKTIGLPSETAAVAVAGVSGNNGGDSAATPGGEVKTARSLLHCSCF